MGQAESLLETTQKTCHRSQFVRKTLDDRSSRVKHLGQSVSLAVDPLAGTDFQIISLGGGRVDGVGDIVDGAPERSVECSSDTLRVGVVKLCLPACRSTGAFAFNVVEETAAPGPAALVGWHCRVDDVDAPFDVDGSPAGDTLACTCGRDGIVGRLRSRRWCSEYSRDERHSEEA